MFFKLGPKFCACLIENTWQRLLMLDSLYWSHGNKFDPKNVKQANVYILILRKLTGVITSADEQTRPRWAWEGLEGGLSGLSFSGTADRSWKGRLWFNATASAKHELNSDIKTSRKHSGLHVGLWQSDHAVS